MMNIKREEEQKVVRLIKRGIVTLGSVVLAGVIWASFTTTVSQGHVGVVFNKTKGGVQEHPLPEGFQWVSPLSKIYEYPVSTETVKYKLQLPTADTKTIEFPISFDYHNEASKTPAIYKEWRGQKPEALEDGYLRRNMLGIASEIASNYTILELNSERGKIQADILKQFSEKVGKKGFIVSSVNLGTPEYDEQTKQAIQQVVNKQQELKAMELEKEKAELNAERQKIEADGNAEAKISEARGMAESELIKATAQAEANKKLEASLTDKILKRMELEARKTHGWVTVNGGTPIVDTRKE